MEGSGREGGHWVMWCVTMVVFCLGKEIARPSLLDFYEKL
jgi:hypothetical protein